MKVPKMPVGNLFDTNAKYICHQVNCRGKMGSGVAKQVKAKYPEVYDMYRKMCVEADFNDELLLGKAQLCHTSDGRVVVNMFAQANYGYDGGVYTSNDAFEACLESIKLAVPKGEAIAMPYNIGCYRGGGDWDIIFPMIVRALCADYEVELWRRGAGIAE